TLWRSPKGGTAVLLVGAASPHPIELWHWRLAPGDVYKADAHLPTTVEVIHVQQGTLSLVVAKRKVSVGPGASVVSRMDQRHQYRNEGRTWTHFSILLVVPN